MSATGLPALCRFELNSCRWLLSLCIEALAAGDIFVAELDEPILSRCWPRPVCDTRAAAVLQLCSAKRQHGNTSTTEKPNIHQAQQLVAVLHKDAGSAISTSTTLPSRWNFALFVRFRLETDGAQTTT